MSKTSDNREPGRVDTALQQLRQDNGLCTEKVLFNIDNQGQWFYLNEPLPTKFARLFSSILQRIDAEYFLITPVEKLKVSVESVALIIVDYRALENGSFELVTDLDTRFNIESVSGFITEEDGVFIDLPNGLGAKLGRACYYRFVEEYLLE
ncbi:DUF1285 domain-containing protein [Shewanella violacea]|uniref:DUF1285 domain-containing protein n=1 Tax=Shewanella violacea (strain JCM 10179 / CIP 106290 / LMG 19151 / DSS12) TaxID=637905 RepID=D4ZJD5_SHEVD|nr:DUF1285 domain-containing protein [Shewanella violacea]BAJ01784.1 conserved hypothetical protein [Shewanella violacea DSS12]